MCLKNRFHHLQFFTDKFVLTPQFAGLLAVWRIGMERDMTTGSPMKLILGFSVPLLFGLLFQQLYSMVDTIIVGHYLGVDALAAVGATG